MRKLLGLLAVTALVALGSVGAASAQHEAGDTLVNVQIGDVTIAVPVAIAANLCDVNVNILAQQLSGGDTTCEATAESVASPGTGDGSGGGHQAGDSLVNVQVGDVTVQLPVAIAANVCGVDVNVLARQLRTGDAQCDAEATSTA